MERPGVAVQLFSLREEMGKDFEGTLRVVSELGYRAVELVSYFGTYGLSSDQLKNMLDDYQLTPIGAHVGSESLTNAFDETVGYYVAAGVPEIIAPSLPHDCYEDAAGFRRGGEWLAQLARKCRALGVGMSYHNHHHDFTHYGDKLGLDLLFEGAASEAVGLEADVYWISYAGNDPPAMIKKYADHIRLVHLKDRPAIIDTTFEDVLAGKSDGKSMFREVGEGIIDWPPVFAAVEQTPARWYVVEQDASTRPMLESVAMSLHHLKEWGRA